VSVWRMRLVINRPNIPVGLLAGIELTTPDCQMFRARTLTISAEISMRLRLLETRMPDKRFCRWHSGSNFIRFII